MSIKKPFVYAIVVSISVCFSYGSSVKAEGLRFAWGLPASATITVTENQGGTQSKARYKLTASQVSADRVSIDFSDFEFLEINGQNAQTVQIPANVQALSRAVPSYIVSIETGQLLEIVNFDDAIAAAISVLPQNDTKTIEKIKQFLTSPQIRSLLYAKSGDMWNAFVGGWVGLDIPAGKSMNNVVDIPVGDAALATAVTYSNFGYVDGSKSLHRYSIETEQSGETLNNILNGVVQKLTQDMLPSGEMSPGRLNGSKKLGRVVSIMDPSTLRPFEVLKEEITILAIDGVPKTKQGKSSHYVFVWEAKN